MLVVISNCKKSTPMTGVESGDTNSITHVVIDAHSTMANTCTQLDHAPTGSALVDWDRFTKAAIESCPRSSRAHWYRAVFLFRIGRPDAAIDELAVAKSGDRMWTTILQQTVEYLVALREAAQNGTNSLPVLPSIQEGRMLQLQEGSMHSVWDPIGAVNQMGSWWNGTVNDIVTLATGWASSEMMWIPGFDRNSGYAPQPPQWWVKKPVVVKPELTPGSTTPPESVGRFGQGTIRNMSSLTMLVISTDIDETKSPHTAELPSCHETPRHIDFDGVRSLDGQPIKNHRGWWKVREPAIRTVSGKHGSLDIDCSDFSLNLICFATDTDHDRKNRWDVAPRGPAIVMQPIPECRSSATISESGESSQISIADDGCNSANTCADCTRRAECGWCGGSGRCMKGRLEGATSCSAGWQPTQKSCSDRCVKHGSCSACTKDSCGWCQSNSTCAAGSPTGPGLMRCTDWRPYSDSCRGR